MNVSALLAGGGLGLGQQVSGYPAAVFYLDALCPGPLADLGRVEAARRRALPAARRAASTYRGSGSRNSVACPAFRSISYSAPSSPNPDGTLGGAAVDVIAEQGLDLLSRGRPVPSLVV